MGSIQTTLLSIVCAEEQCELLREFLKSRYMDEQLNALLAVLEFELIPTPQNGKSIFERFIVDGAPEEVTMAGKKKEKILCGWFQTLRCSECR